MHVSPEHEAELRHSIAPLLDPAWLECIILRMIQEQMAHEAIWCCYITLLSRRLEVQPYSALPEKVPTSATYVKTERSTRALFDIAIQALE
ncbi:MAG TPA: hypothetical protein VF345_04205 [Chthoniobacterales bacterium]